MKHKILGLAILFIGCYLIFDSAVFYYFKYYVGSFHTTIIPTYEMVFRFVIGLLFVPTGWLIYTNKMQGFALSEYLGWGILVIGIVLLFFNLSGVLFVLAGGLNLLVLRGVSSEKSLVKQ